MRELLTGLVSLACIPVRVKPDPARMRPAAAPVLIGDSSCLRALGWQLCIPLARTLAHVLGCWRKSSS